jgi:hypothetical protein
MCYKFYLLAAMLKTSNTVNKIVHIYVQSARTCQVIITKTENQNLHISKGKYSHRFSDLNNTNPDQTIVGIIAQSSSNAHSLAWRNSFHQHKRRLTVRKKTTGTTMTRKSTAIVAM